MEDQSLLELDYQSRKRYGYCAPNKFVQEREFLLKLTVTRTDTVRLILMLMRKHNVRLSELTPGTTEEYPF